MWTQPAARGWRGGRRADRRPFHSRLPGYRPTPLRAAPELAGALGVGAVLVKDESRRFDLDAFKILGASWGAYRALRERLGPFEPWCGVADLRQALARLDPPHLLTATAGNHGRAVARMGRWLGVPTVVLVPSATAPEVVAAIAADGADVRTVAGGYDDAVAAADRAARDSGHLLVQDTAWPGYERVPGWIVEGYQTLFHELDDQLAADGLRPDLVVVPVGVGSLLSAAVAHYRAPAPTQARPAPPGERHRTPTDARPALLAVEPATAAGLLASLRAGRPVQVPTAQTVMAGLNAGTVSSTAWPLLHQGLDAAIAVTEAEVHAARGDLAGAGLTTGFCGAATLAGVTSALTAPDATGARAALGLTPTSTVVLIGTDGAPTA